MKKVNYWLNLLFGVFFLMISLFIGLLTPLILLGDLTVFGVKPEMIGLFFRGSNGAPSMVPIFIGFLALSGSILLGQSLKCLVQK